MRSPGGRDAVFQRQTARGVFGDVHHRKVVHRKRPDEGKESDGDEQQLTAGGATRRGHPPRVIAGSPGQTKCGLQQGELQGDNQGDMPEFGNHD